MIAFLALGDVIVALIYQTGRFGHDDVLYVWGILAGSTVGLLASTLGRLYASGFYALRDTRTPLRFAIVRVVLTSVLGYYAALHLPGQLGVEQRWGAAGLTISAGVASWVEFALLQRALRRRTGHVGLAFGFQIRVWSVAVVAAAVARGLLVLLGSDGRLVVALPVLAVYGALFLGAALALRLPEAHAMLGVVRRRIGR